MTVNILGREYSIYTRPRAEDAKLNECDGYCDYSVDEIVIVQREDDPMNMRDQDTISKRVLRHELIHAFAAESGLADESAWAVNEEMTDSPSVPQDARGVQGRWRAVNFTRHFAAPFPGAAFACLYRAGAGSKERLRRYSGLPRRTGNRGG